jgi:hypothetical protein
VRVARHGVCDTAHELSVGSGVGIPV